MKKVKKEKGENAEGVMEYLEISLSDAEELIYDLLLRIAEKVNA